MFRCIMDDGTGGGEMSIADMVRQAAADVYHSRVPEGFEWYESYGQYYSQECGFFYDPNSGLFYHSESETYYVFNDESQQYEVYRCMQTLDWTIRGYESRARELLGDEVDRFGRDGAAVCECLFAIVDTVSGRKIKPKISKEKLREREEAKCQNRRERRRLAQQRSMIATEDPDLIIYDGAAVEDEDYLSEPSPLNSDVSEDELEPEVDERLQMMEDEGFSQPPLLRIMDQLDRLFIVTICGGVVGRTSDCELFLEDTGIAKRSLEFFYVAESNSFVVKRLCNKSRRIHLNDYLLEVDDDKELEHGDILRLGSSQLNIHVHYGNNTCPGCEPGLMKSAQAATSSVPRVVGGETARRRTLKMLKQSYGVSHYDSGSFGPRSSGSRRATGPALHEIRREKGGVPTGRSDDIYAGCTARPVPGATVPVKPVAASQNKSISSENKGFKLLASMGWKEGEGLGKDKGGRVEPVVNDVKVNRAGLGSDDKERMSMKRPSSQKEAIMDATRKRYQQISNAEK